MCAVLRSQDNQISAKTVSTILCAQYNFICLPLQIDEKSGHRLDSEFVLMHYVNT